MQDQHACAVTALGEPLCWSWLDGPGADFRSALVPPSEAVVGVATAWHSTCWVLSAGGVTCGGSDDHGQSSPPSEPVAFITGGGAHYCATLAADGSLSCWGYDPGDGNVRDVPANAPKVVDAGATITCVIDSVGAATCYGIRASVANIPNPYAPDGTFEGLGAADDPCFIRAGGLPECVYDAWNRCEDEPVGPFHAIAASYHSICGALDQGGLLCWMEDPDRVNEPDNCLVGDVASLPWTD